MTALAERPYEEPGLVGLFPPTQLAEHLLPPLRRAGVPFVEAWDLAFDRVLWPLSAREKREWRAQLNATKMAWWAAYDGEPPTEPEKAVGGLAGVFDALAQLSESTP